MYWILYLSGYVNMGSGYGILNDIIIQEGGVAYLDEAGGNGDKEDRFEIYLITSVDCAVKVDNL